MNVPNQSHTDVTNLAALVQEPNKFASIQLMRKGVADHIAVIFEIIQSSYFNILGERATAKWFVAILQPLPRWTAHGAERFSARHRID